ncbi:monovalent cation/H(+) antiporter subunit G [Verticiella sediminum]|uniref:Monovalent cation/H(+) antiporter subunit G n=1 Tax=Verticiella sediminum TaxID=1247510 RepID=A0A556AKN2_9BURK|nr:monovalent cation/H(+) antiporter subunit G [Verticiella sediminum]TSH93452.1 monovalent cation/H(+) antiporter subunit G [Verticiella sediminum]
MLWLSAVFLLAGSLLCLIAAVGVLRLQDFFMRTHAATKAGVAGCGLFLIGVGCADNTLGTWIKVGVAIVFLLVTTPLSGHLLGRAGYVGGVPLWKGTRTDALHDELPRGTFEAQEKTDTR